MPRPGRSLGWVALVCRCGIGGAFVWFGATKAGHPEAFLKLLRQYGVFERPLALNLVAAGLPWLEIVCGLLLLTGVAVRGTAALLLAMLGAFTAVVVWRAHGLQGAGTFCAVAFDCGCGTGVVRVCRKLVENGALAVGCAWLAVTDATLGCWRHTLWSGAARNRAPATAGG